MKGLSKRKSIIIANKMDLPEAEENLELLKADVDIDPNLQIIPISAKEKQNTEELKSILKNLILGE
jgi:GTP-binding protein